LSLRSPGAAFDFVDAVGGTVHLIKRLRWNDNAPVSPDRINGHPRG
jgi:hypothetical protein